MKIKKFILLLICILIIITLVGCSKPKAPEGFTQEFYDDIIKTCNDLYKEVKNIKKEDVIGKTTIKFNSFVEFAEKYYESRENGILTVTEEIATDLLVGVVLYIQTDLKFYYTDNWDFPTNSTLEKIEKLSDVLEVETKLNELGIK